MATSTNSGKQKTEAEFFDVKTARAVTCPIVEKIPGGSSRKHCTIVGQTAEEGLLQNF